MAFEEQIIAWVTGDGEQRPSTITTIQTLLEPPGVHSSVSDVEPIRQRALWIRMQGHHGAGR
ncbi:hypothetical protein [Mycobacterium pseudokansasii]|uniref:Uncharacterized protein n=2 Tax=Mycobacterium pseudokansasii TaxID=2341080 RepID=A0A498QU12_9MYCO|nr:hypothetical protein [Mycobacterium pseudokansasii]KZS61423.1 hypothetical protein A4G27_03700 [Mycobacterium kansasii]VAZ97541.1 hypothetical protein LAUMK35_03712 [Mycobacterium pseudokansasii]VAZ99002.1 hypothetical protein LAUMK21_03709 [Mycobacterium pseudokansasii]VBA52538.1 hypothetical protein LAUMK142_03600 [Mycobacterium pseudokansasii]